MKKSLLLFLVVVGTISCATMTPRAAKIMLHTQISTQLDSCKKLGPVTAEASAWEKLDWATVEQQAKNNLREAAAAKYGDEVDAVALINVDRYATKVVANGIAFKCF